MSEMCATIARLEGGNEAPGVMENLGSLNERQSGGAVRLGFTQTKALMRERRESATVTSLNCRVALLRIIVPYHHGSVCRPTYHATDILCWGHLDYAPWLLVEV
jgi:hypothetical protein